MRPTDTWLRILAFFALAAAPLHAQRNLDGEAHENGVPTAWKQDHGGAGYALTSVAEEPYEGRRCLRLAYVGDAPPDDWGWAYQKFTAAPYLGKWVRFRAAVRVEGEAAAYGARLYVESFGAGSRSLSTDVMEDRPVHGGEWRLYEAFAEVPAEAETLQIGISVKGPGVAYLDAGSVEVIGEAGARPAEASGPWNLDFVRPEPTGQWAWTSYLGEYVPRKVNDGPDRQGVMLEFDGDPDQGFGNLLQGVDAETYRGALVRLTGRVRVEPKEGAKPGTRAQMWLRVDLPDGGMGFFDNMDDRPLLPGEWRHAEITGLIDDDAESIVFGLMVMGSARVYWDDVGFEPLERASDPPRPLDENGLTNLLAFARLLGYVRHFHPSDAAAVMDWDAFAAHGVRRVEGCSGDGELLAELRELLRPIAPTVQVFARGEAPPLPEGLRPPESLEPVRVTAWKHAGFGREGSGIYTSSRPRKRVRDGRLPDDLPDPAEPFEADLPGGLRCRVPLALYVDRDGTLPRGGEPPPLDGILLVEDRATRLAAVILAWNVLQHFFPYFDVVEVDWPAALAEALRGAAADEGVEGFRRTLERMVAHLDDGHAWITHERQDARYALPLRWEWIEDRLIVTEIAETYAGELPLPGDAILSIGGVAVEDAIARESVFVSASHDDARRDRTVDRLRAGTPHDEVTLLIETPAGERRELTLTYELYASVPEPRPDVVEEIEPGIWYVDIDRLTEEELESALDDLAAAKGLIFDLRGYPKAARMIPSYLTGETLQSPSWEIPLVTKPDQVDLAWRRTSWPLPPMKPRFTAPTAFLADSRTQSAAETYLSFVEQYLLAEIVGEPTSGTNGNINPFEIPGGYSVSWTGMRTLKQDGSRHHGVGILPTVPAGRTRQGVIEGRDEVLQAALAVVHRAIDEGRGAGVEPRTAGQFVFRAGRRFRAGELPAAIEAATRALALDPEHPAASSLRGRALHALGRSEEARADLDRALAAAPDDFAALAARGAVRYDLGDAAGARADLEAAAGGDEATTGEALATLGWIERKEGRADEALARFEEALDLDRRNEAAALGAASVRYARADWRAALADLRRAKRARPFDAGVAPLFQWLVRVRLDEPDKGARELERELERWTEGDAFWFPPLAEYVLGRRDADALLGALEHEDPREERLARSRASYWIGIRATLDGDADSAREHFRACVGAGFWNTLAHACAEAELTAK